MGVGKRRTAVREYSLTAVLFLKIEMHYLNINDL